VRSISWAGAFALLAVSAAMAALASVRRRGALWMAGIAVVLAIIIAFPLRESIHFLGDTQLRLRSMLGFGEGIVVTPFEEWASRLHASPLDIAIDLMIPVSVMRAGWPLRDGVSVASVLLALGYFASLWRIGIRIGAPADVRVPLVLTLGLTGSLVGFAGYAESAGLVLASAAWWWSEALTPLTGPARAARLAAAWVAVLMAHRLGAVLLLPMLWRSLGPRWEGDLPAARRILLVMVAVVVAAGSLALFATPAGIRVRADANEMLLTLRRMDFVGAAPSDWLNTLALVAPLAWIVLFAVGKQELAAFTRRPEFGLALSLAIPLLLALLFVFPAGGSGLGAQRDWDSSAMLGLTLTMMAGSLLVRLPSGPLRTRLAWMIPVLALGSLGFIAVQANEPAAERRALAFVSQPPRLPDPQLSHAHLFLAHRAMDHGLFDAGARHFELAFDLNPSPRRALLAAEAWAAAGDFEAARRALDRARGRGPLDADLSEVARRIEAMLGADPAERRGREGSR
jgi:hypothetical protein